MRLESKDILQDNIEKIGGMFPGVVTEAKDENGQLKKAINFEKLQQFLGNDIMEGNECYDFTWVGKKAAMYEVGRPTRKTLRPCPEESKNWDTTENLYIEGDNLEVLKLLQESYLGKVKMIYIDPPYNTGNDFVYRDDFAMSREQYEEEKGVYDENGDRLFRNTESNGRFHSDWCSMMYPRLVLARNLLTDDGVIFISIDDNEVDSIRKICDEVFGEVNFVALLIWKSGRTASAHFTHQHEYVLVFAKEKSSLPLFVLRENDIVSDRTTKKPTQKNPLSRITFPKGIDFECEDKIFPDVFGGNEPIKVISGKLEAKDMKLASEVTLEAAWAMRDMIEDWLSGKDVIDQKGQKVIRFFFKNNGVLQYEKQRGTIHPPSIINGITTKAGSSELNKLFNDTEIFNFPKPHDLVKSFLDKVTEPHNNDIVLDFFSGSATTAHAVMQLNAENGGGGYLGSAASLFSYSFPKRPTKRARRSRQATPTSVKSARNESVEPGKKSNRMPD